MESKSEEGGFRLSGWQANILRENCTFGEMLAGENPQQNYRLHIPTNLLMYATLLIGGRPPPSPTQWGRQISKLGTHRQRREVVEEIMEGGRRHVCDVSMDIAADDTNNAGTGNSLGGSGAIQSNDGTGA